MSEGCSLTFVSVARLSALDVLNSLAAKERVSGERASGSGVCVGGEMLGVKHSPFPPQRALYHSADTLLFPLLCLVTAAQAYHTADTRYGAEARPQLGNKERCIFIEGKNGRLYVLVLHLLLVEE